MGSNPARVTCEVFSTDTRKAPVYTYSVYSAVYMLVYTCWCKIKSVVYKMVLKLGIYLLWLMRYDILKYKPLFDVIREVHLQGQICILNLFMSGILYFFPVHRVGLFSVKNSEKISSHYKFLFQ